MAKNVLIVESPAKAKTINKYLGNDFIVLASYGHVRGLVPKDGAVEVDNNFHLNYEIVERNAKHIKAIEKAMQNAENLYLATDPDREGEAISWHIYEILNNKNLLKSKRVSRVVFNEITKTAVVDAIKNARQIAMPLVNAQQARSALDFLIGFNLSPLLWRKVRTGLSAGRVQSPALRLICQREEEIDAFISQEYWSIKAGLNESNQSFDAKLTKLNDKKLTQFDINNDKDAFRIVSELKQASKSVIGDGNDGVLVVSNVEKKERKRYPSPPFITSTLQQEASRKLGFGAQRTMRLAQTLYEGVAVNGENVGLITYMRTDSVHLANEAVSSIREHIKKNYGEDYVPSSARFYKNKSKNAQEAHEAIRPTAVAYTPKSLQGQIEPDLFKLYDLIWKRAVACQMEHATLDTVAVDLDCGTVGQFRANGSTIKHPGFIVLYQESKDDNKDDDDNQSTLPALEVNQKINLVDILPTQHFTEPPPRYTEASLVKILEEYGIGRPSTYANIMQTLITREYVLIETKRLFPTSIGKIVNQFLTKHFTQYVDYDFTAQLEDELDEVSRGEKEWIPLLESFWKPFNNTLQEKKDVTREEVMQARELGLDPKTGKPISVRYGRFGPFVQIGTKEDEEKPKFASLTSDMKFDQVTLEQALILFQLPRELGETEEGEPIKANNGRFGPYVQYGKSYVSIGKEDDVYSISLERALELIKDKKEADAKKFIKEFNDGEIQVLHGRFGPYVKKEKINAKIPKDVDPESLTLEDCLKLIEETEKKKKTGKSSSRSSSKTKAKPTTKESAKTTTKKATTKAKATTSKSKTVSKDKAETKTATKKPATKKTTKAKE